MSIFVETRNPENRGGGGEEGKGAENVQNRKEENQQQTQLTYDEEPGIRTRGKHW